MASGGKVRRLGSVAQWLCTGLQIQLRRFDSGPSLQMTANTTSKPPCLDEAGSTRETASQAVFPKGGFAVKRDISRVKAR